MRVEPFLEKKKVIRDLGCDEVEFAVPPKRSSPELASAKVRISEVKLGAVP